MNLNAKQLDIKAKIERIADAMGVDRNWALGIAMTESSLGLYQKSPTGCRGVFQMSSIAMKDLLLEMENINGDEIDIACGLAFLLLLRKRWGSIEEATSRFCDPNDRHFYIDRAMKFKREFESESIKQGELP